MLSLQLKQFIEEFKEEDINSLALKGHLFPDIDIKIAIDQIKGRRIAKEKLPTWFQSEEVYYPSSKRLEQSSSEVTAAYKASLMYGERIIDMTGGFGVDTFYFSKKFKQVDYFEINNSLSRIVEYNLKILGANNIKIHHQSSEELITSKPSGISWIYIDPSRRDSSGNKKFLIKDCTPNIERLHPDLIYSAENVLIKLSPILDISSIISQINNIRQIYVVAVKNECKELLIHLSKAKSKSNSIKINCIDLYADRQDFFTGGLNKEAIILDYAYPQAYLYEPNKAILKGNLQDAVAKHYQLAKLERNSHFYTSENLIENFPGRVFRFHSILKPRKKNIKEAIPDLSANIISRNYPQKASVLYESFRIKPHLNRFLLATTLQGGERRLILCERLK